MSLIRYVQIICCVVCNYCINKPDDLSEYKQSKYILGVNSGALNYFRWPFLSRAFQLKPFVFHLDLC